MTKRDLRSFKNKGLTREDIKAAARKANVQIGDVPDEQIRSMEETIEKYGSKSENELMSDLERMIREGRKNGTFSDEMLDAFVKNVGPMLDGAQRKKLDSIARMIKNREI